MARIRRTGLDYFPMDTGFINDRLVRRLLKHEGDSALSLLLTTLCHIYGGEGYYVKADEAFCEDIATMSFSLKAEDVKRILDKAAEYGIFDKGMLQQHGILTSAEIQRQYTFSAKRRKHAPIDSRFCLWQEGDGSGENAAENTGSAAGNTQSTAQQSTRKQSTTKQSKEKPQKSGSPVERGTCSEEDIARLVPPDDGLQRNYPGLLENLRQFHIPPDEQYAIIIKTNFGVIGHQVWRGFYTLRDSRGKIRMPGKFLLSLC